MPALPIILAGIQAAIGAAPAVVEVIKSAKDLITSLFTAGLITADQQNALHAWVDAHSALVKAGLTPPAWTVEPDPE
jgi:hypothetical protein